jgi:DNA-binding NtrC family response regulator
MRLILVAGERKDWPALEGVAETAMTGPSPADVMVAHTDGLDGGDALDVLNVRRFAWPSAADDLICAIRASDDSSRSMEERMVDRLLNFTPSLAPLAERLVQAASHDLTVLLTGETGTGKTFLARLLHDFSPRRNHPFLMVPCGAQSSNLFESCFFGHVKGAFTGAHQAQRGKFAAAGKGTILLDEIDTLGHDQQASLLRVIETGEYEQVGGHVTYRSEARIIAASNWDLEDLVETGRLRQDLYYRINVLSFHLPPLRDRAQDIGPLARAFVSHFGARFKKPTMQISGEAMAILEAFHWPGNIRQLENTLQQAVLVATGPELTAADLPDLVRRSRPFADVPVVLTQSAANGVASGYAHRKFEVNGPGKPLLQSRADFERLLISKALQDNRFNRSSAARSLGVSRVTLHKKIKQYGLTDLARRNPVPVKRPPLGSRPADVTGDDGDAFGFSANGREPE